jgi:hypothetical protein
VTRSQARPADGSADGPAVGSADGSAAPIRRLLTGVVLVGTLGLTVELLLLEHWDSPWQWAPLALLTAALGATLAAWRRPGPRTLRLLRGVMAVCVAAGALGVWLHYDGNAEFERERDPSIGGVALFREAITGATPALAPGALAQLGLLGLLLAYRHPADRARARAVHVRPARADRPRLAPTRAEPTGVAGRAGSPTPHPDAGDPTCPPPVTTAPAPWRG